MKILLQNIQTKLYFSLLGVWTDKPNLAYDFRHSARALDFARANELTEVQLVVRFEDSQWDNIVPVPLQVATLCPADRGCRSTALLGSSSCIGRVGLPTLDGGDDGPDGKEERSANCCSPYGTRMPCLSV